MNIQNNDGNAKNQKPAGGADAIEQGGIAQQRFQTLGGEGDGALIREDGQGGEDGADAEGFDEGHGGEAVHHRFDGEGLHLTVEAVLERADDRHGTDAKEDGAGDEAFAETFWFGGIVLLECVFGVFAEFVDAFLEAEEFADHVADDQGDEDDDDLFHDGPEAAVDGGPGGFESDVNGEQAEDQFEAIFDFRRNAFGDDEADQAAEDNGANVDDGSDHRRAS